MPLLVYLDYAYVFPRFGVWLLLLIASCIDGWRHRSIRSRGYQLYFALVGVVFLFVLRDSVLVASSIQSHQGGSPNEGTFDVYIFFTALADSVWFAILLSVAAGFCITRNSLGPHKSVVVIIPLIFFVTSLVVDYVLYYAKGFDAFNAAAPYREPDVLEPDETVGEFTGLVFFLCIIANMMAFMLAWFYIFDTIQKEREILEGKGGAQDQAAGEPSPAHGSQPYPYGPSIGQQDAGVGHREVPDDINLLEQGQPPSHMPVMYGGVVDDDLDAPKTVQDRIQQREKIRLMRQFFYGVSFYVVATLLVLFMPIFVNEVVDKTMLILQNAVLWLFLASLCFIFRMREDNPYLVLDEEAETGLSGVETTTELGVLAHPGSDPLPPPTYSQAVQGFKAGAGPGGGSGAGGTGGAALHDVPALAPPPGGSRSSSAQHERHQQGGEVEGWEGGEEEEEAAAGRAVGHQFTLGDEEDEELGHSMEQRMLAGVPSSSLDPSASIDVNGHAAKQGVLVTVLPSPKMP